MLITFFALRLTQAYIQTAKIRSGEDDKSVALYITSYQASREPQRSPGKHSRGAALERF